MPLSTLLEFIMPRRLWGRLRLSLTSVLAVIVLLATIPVVMWQASLVIELLVVRGQGLARSIAGSSINPLLAQDLAGLEQLALGQVQSINVQELQILDSSGKVAADIDTIDGAARARFGRTFVIPEGAATGVVEHLTIIDLFGRKIYRAGVNPVIWQPIREAGTTLGWVRLTVGAEAAHVLQHDVVRASVLLALAIVLFSLGGLYLLMRRPMAELARAASFATALTEEHGRQVPGSTASFEINALFNVLNSVSAQLAARDVALMRDRRFLEGLMENLSDGVYVTDTEGQCIFFNREAEHITGWSRGEAVGKSAAALLKTELTRGVAMTGDSPGRQAMATGSVVRSEAFRFVRKDGSVVPISLAATPLIIEGQCTGVVMAFQDIGLRKQAEEAMREAREAAEAASRAKSNFLAVVSHELRTPMNSILGMTYLALQSDLTPRQRDYLAALDGSAQKLMHIINDILDYSKMMDRHLRLQNTDFDLSRVFSTLASEVSAEITARKLQWSQTIAADVPHWLAGDGERLAQALGKLVENAVKFTEHGSIALSVRLEQVQEDGLLLRFTVVDTGLGLSAVARKALFESFHQPEDALRRNFGGMGLGLAIASELAHLMQGEIGVDSEEGQGSSFWMTARFGRGKVGLTAGPTPLRENRLTALSGAARSVAADLNALEPALRELTVLLRDNDFGARAALERHAALFQSVSPVLYREIDAALHTFDFENALSSLEQFEKEAGLSPGHVTQA